jgi:hypothetical protein
VVRDDFYFVKIGGSVMKKQAVLLVTVFIFASLISIESAFAGAWTVPKDHVWAEYYMKWNYSKESYNERGNTTSLTSGGTNAFRAWEFVQEPKLEFGVTDYLNLLYSMEFKEGHYKEYDRPDDWGPFSHKNGGLTNIKIGGKWRFLEKPLVMSLQGRFFIYPGYGNYVSEKPDGGEDGYPYQPGIGRGDDAFELRWLMGQSFQFPVTSRWKLPIYWGAETGYRWRNKTVCNDVPYFFECGFWPSPYFLVKTEIDGYVFHSGTGSLKESYGIWRIGGVWQVFGDSVLRQGGKMFNIELQYGLVTWGVNTNAAQEVVLKVQTQF